MVTKTSSQYILDTSREYSVYVCSERAIPNITDGLKPSQRKMLWLMKTQSEKIKTISLAGAAIQTGLFLHGDASASETISRMAAPYCNNVCYLEGVGTFGSRISPRAWGAPRYTYVKKSKMTDKLIYPDLDIVPLKDNYDGSTKEPETFLPLIPLILLNGISGIAVGWSTDILPRSLDDLINATLAAIDDRPVKKLIPKYEYLKLNTKLLSPNLWEFSGKIEIIDTSIVKINELPPNQDIEKFKERLNRMEEEDLISEYSDNSTDKIDIQIKLKRAFLADMDEEKLLDFFKLREKFSERIVVIDWNGNSIKQYDDPKEIIQQFVKWRLTWYTKRYQKRIDDDSYELRYWEGLYKCFEDKLPDRLRLKNNRTELETDIKKITKDIGLDETQIDKIVNLSSVKWLKDYFSEVKNNIKILKDNIKNHNSILKDKNKIKAIYRQEVEALRRH